MNTAQTSTHPLRSRLVQLATRPLFALLACFAIAFAAYAPALGGGFVWDDAYLVGENPFFRSPVFALETFRHWLFFDSFSTYYRPVQNLSYLLDYWLWRGHPLGYHVTNVALHALAGFLLCLLLRQLFPAILRSAGNATAPIAALLVACVWTAHPVHNAAVAYISGRADSLAAVFALGAWWLALRAETVARPAARRALIGGAFAAILLALCAKEIALMWLVLFTAHALWRWRGHFPRQAANVAAVLAAVAVYAALHHLPARRSPMEDAPPPPLEARALLMLRALGDYSGLMLYPARLQMERELSDASAYRSVASWRQRSRGEWLTIAGFLTLLGSVVLCRWNAPGRALRIAGAGWFGVAFLPISNLFPLNAEVAEHWIYLASIGFLLFLGGVALALPAKAQRWAAAAAAVAILALGARTAVRSADWVDAETFCQRTIAAGGASPRILATLAGIYGARGDWTRQEHVLRKTLDRFPAHTPSRIQLGVCLTRQGRKDEAEPLLAMAPPEAAESARRYPRTWPAALQLAALKKDAGDPAAALAIIAETRARFPETWDVVRVESELQRELHGPAAAVAPVENFAATHWWHLGAWLALGQARAAAGQLDGARAAFAHADRLDLYDGRALAGLARVELAAGRHDSALDTQLAAIARDEAEPAHYFELGALLDHLGRRAEAEGAVRKAQLLAARSATR